MALPMRAAGYPINSTELALLTRPQFSFGQNPWQPSGLSGVRGMRGCGCGPAGGCGCTPGMSGLRQNVSLDQIISNAFNWFSGVVQTQLPPSASLPPQYGSAGSISTQVQQWLPWIIGGYLVYRLIK
jgi:hypothetical protein